MASHRADKYKINYEMDVSVVIKTFNMHFYYF